MFKVGDIITGTLNSPYKITNSFGEYLVIETGIYIAPFTEKDVSV